MRTKSVKRISPLVHDQWSVLVKLVEDYADAKIAESWKGGGDPSDIPVVEAELVLARAKLNAHFIYMQKKDGPQS